MLAVIPALHFTAGRAASSEPHLVQLVNHLEPAPGDRVRVLAHAGNRTAFRPRSSRVEIVTWPRFAQTRAGRMVADQLLAPAYLQSAGADLLHFPGQVGPALVPCPTVGTLHMVHDRTLRSYLPLTRRTYFTVLECLSTRRASRLIAVSRSCKEAFVRERQFPADRIDVIYHGISDAFHAPPAKAVVRSVRDRFGLDGPYVLSVTSTAAYKRTDLLVQAFGLLKKQGYPHRLVIAGNAAPDAVRTWVQATPGLEQDDIVLTGYLPLGELPPLYAGAEALAYVSASETFGIPLIEAMSQALPAVVSPLPALLEVGGDAVLPARCNSAAAVADGLATVLEDSKLRVRLREAAARRASLFSWNTAARQTLEVYGRALTCTVAKRGGSQS